MQVYNYKNKKIALLDKVATEDLVFFSIRWNNNFKKKIIVFLKHTILHVSETFCGDKSQIYNIYQKRDENVIYFSLGRLNCSVFWVFLIVEGRIMMTSQSV